MQPCFLCGALTDSIRSVTKATSPPSSREDAVPICPACDPDWTATLLACAEATKESTKP